MCASDRAMRRFALTASIFPLESAAIRMADPYTADAASPRVGRAFSAWAPDSTLSTVSILTASYLSQTATSVSPSPRRGTPRSSPRKLLLNSYNRSTYAAFIFFGLASWVMTNTTYVELSYFMLHLPEKLSIFPYAMFALQSANVYPILYMWLNPGHRRLSLDKAVWLCLMVGLVVCICMSMFWDRTAFFLGREHSYGKYPAMHHICRWPCTNPRRYSCRALVAMLLLTHLGGMVSATTSVIFYPYVATFPPIYTSALSTGEGLSGSIIGVLGLWQKPYAENMTFSVGVFYLACVAIVLASVAAFGFLELHPKATGERIQIASSKSTGKIGCYDTDPGSDGHHDVRPSTDIRQSARHPVRHRVFQWFWKELACQAVLSAVFYGVLPSITSFLFARYSPNDPARAAKHQMIASTMIFFVDPMARFLTSFYRFYTVYIATLFLFVVGVLLLVCTLLTSPPCSGDNELGYLFPLILYITSSGVYSYTQTMLVLAVKQQADCTRDALFAESAYQWSGFLIQMGAFVGTLIIFPLTIAFPQLFQAGMP